MNKKMELVNAINSLVAACDPKNVDDSMFVKRIETMQALEALDYNSLLQALHYRAETVYAYTGEGDCGTGCNYLGLELFPCKASSIYCHCEKEEFGIVLMDRYLELWMLEDFSFALVASTETDYEDGEFSTAYRVIRSTDLGEIAQEMKLDLERIAAQLIRLADSYGMSGMPTYEL